MLSGTPVGLNAMAIVMEKRQIPEIHPKLRKTSVLYVLSGLTDSLADSADTSAGLADTSAGSEDTSADSADWPAKLKD